MRAFTFLLIALIASTTVAALGVTPARIILDGQGAFTFRPILDGTPGTLSVSIEGDLAEYITLTEQTPERITGVITPPEDIAPGEHAQKVILSFTPETASGTVAAATQIVAALIVRIPYNGPYLQGDVAASTDRGSGIVYFTLSLENVGDERLAMQTLQLQLQDPTTTDAITLEPQQLQPGAAVRIDQAYARLRDGGATPGIYTVTLDATYGTRSFTRERNLTLGIPKLSLTSVDIVQEEGDILPIDIAGEIVWNVPLQATLALYVDNESEPTLTQEITTRGSFTQRLYLENVQPPSTIHVTLAADGVLTQIETSLAKPEARASSPWMRAALIAIALLMLLVAILLLKGTSRQE